MRLRSLLLLLLLSTMFAAVSVLAEEDPPQAAIVRGYRAADAIPILERTRGGPTAADLLNDLANVPESAFVDKKSLRFDGSRKGDVIRVYCFYREDGNKQAEVRIKEEPRQPIVVGQLKVLARLISAIAAGLPEAGLPPVVMEKFDYTTTLKRATLSVSAEIKDNPQGQVGGGGANNDVKWVVVFDFTKTDDGKNAPKTVASVLTGPREAWSISADVPVGTIGDVNFDDKGENIELADTPDAFYAGFNYALAGDVARPPSRFLEAVTVKGLLKASRRPSDSFGIGIGLRPGLFRNAHPLLQIFDTLSPYVAYTRTRVEENQDNADGTTTKVRFKRNDITVGISLDITKALDFVKGNGGGDGEKEE